MPPSADMKTLLQILAMSLEIFVKELFFTQEHDSELNFKKTCQHSNKIICHLNFS